MKSDITINKSFNPISITLIVIAAITGLLLEQLNVVHWSIAAILVLVLLVIAASIRIADQWEKAVVLRMGKFLGLRGPGIFLIIPIIDRVNDYIDQRVRVTDITAEKTLTKDTVPVDVDAVDETPGLSAANDLGYLIDEAEVIYWGICPTCQTEGISKE